MNNRNQPKRICSEVVYSEKVQRISDMKWAGSRHEAHTGICQFCNNVLPHAYRVFDREGKMHEVTAESKGGAKAQNWIEEDAIPEGIYVYALAACEVMTDEDLFYNGIAHYEKRTEEWKDLEKQKAARRIALAESSKIPAKAGWR